MFLHLPILGQNYIPYYNEYSGEDFQFPIFRGTSNKYAVEKINQLLQISKLEILKGYEENNIFERVSYKEEDGNLIGGMMNIKFEVLSNTDKTLSIKFDLCVCGASCSYWINYFNFNTGNGDLFQLSDLFSDEGYKQFSEYAAKKRTNVFRKNLVGVDSLFIANYIAIYGCYDDINFADFYIQNNSLFLDGNDCFTLNSILENINTVCEFQINEIEPYLNAYGKSVFGLNQDSVAKHQSKSLPQLFNGFIGKKQILLVINEYDNNNIVAYCFYAKEGKKTDLLGQVNEGILTLEEKDTNFQTIGAIKATYEGTTINGTWTDKKTGKSYKLWLTRK